MNGRERTLGRDHLWTLEAAYNISLALWERREYTKTLGLYERILCVRDKLLGPDHLMTITIVDEIAQVFQVQENHKKALERYERALAGCEKLPGSRYGHQHSLQHG